MHDVEQSLLTRVSDQDETVFMQAVGILGAQLIIEGSRRFFERYPVLLEIGHCPSRVPDEAHGS